MNQDSLFKPTPELMQEWLTKWKAKRATVPYDEFFATEAARWGADQELEACCTEIHALYGKLRAESFRSKRRPEPTSLKERAITIVENLIICEHLSKQDETTLLDALESLPD
jgi:kynurenine formamidase